MNLMVLPTQKSSNAQFFEIEFKKTENTIIENIFITLVKLQQANFDLNSSVGKEILKDIGVKLKTIGTLSESESESDKRVYDFFQTMRGLVLKDILGSEPLIQSFGEVKKHTTDCPNLIGGLIIAESIDPILNFAKILDERNISIINDINALSKASVNKINARL